MSLVEWSIVDCQICLGQSTIDNLSRQQFVEMSSFKGSDTYSVDAKGRVSVPSKMRRNISPDAHGTFVLTRGLEKCLYCYPVDEWKRLEGSIQNLQQESDQDRFYLR